MGYLSRKTTKAIRARHILLAGSLIMLTACGSSDDNNSSISDTEGDVSFRVTLTTHWNASDFPTRYPSSAHWSAPIGTAHNEQVIYWREDVQPASDGIESMAETGATGDFEVEINAAKNSGYSQGVIKMDSISDGAGSSSIEFSTSDSFPLLTLTSMIAPSPDWFIGVDSLSLKEDGEWITEKVVQLHLYDAGTDNGESFASADLDSRAQDQPITLVSTERDDSDFENGVHFSSGAYVATLTITRL